MNLFDRPRPEPTTGSPAKETRPNIHPNLVLRTILPLWQERRWRQNGNLYEGYYRTPYGSFRGRIVYRFSGYFDYYILDPPACLQNHSHARCFIRKGDVYEIHFSRRGRTIDDGLMEVERILTEAHRI